MSHDGFCGYCKHYRFGRHGIGHCAHPTAGSATVLRPEATACVSFARALQPSSEAKREAAAFGYRVYTRRIGD